VHTITCCGSLFRGWRQHRDSHPLCLQYLVTKLPLWAWCIMPFEGLGWFLGDCRGCCVFALCSGACWGVLSAWACRTEPRQELPGVAHPYTMLRLLPARFSLWGALQLHVVPNQGLVVMSLTTQQLWQRDQSLPHAISCHGLGAFIPWLGGFHAGHA
jgi:hypothetical protein